MKVAKLFMRSNRYYMIQLKKHHVEKRESMENESAWRAYDDKEIECLEKLTTEYKKFISECKTERECASKAIAEAESCGYKPLESVVSKSVSGDGSVSLMPGDKIWASHMGKAVVLVHIGTRPMEEGMNILGAHIDSPRLDIKQNPMYEKDGLALLDTHYYGGIKKYQWVAVPLAIHGVVAKKDGSVVNVCIGEDPSDPVFCVSDLLPHLGNKQLEKKGSEVVEGEDLDIIVGSRPSSIDKGDKNANEEESSKDEQKKDPVCKRVLSLIAEKYDIVEEDFLSSELEVVPAGAARDAGFDYSMVLGYGQDDRVCAFTSLEAQLNLAKNEAELGIPEKTCVCVLVDKEEIGSVGATGMESMFFENTIAEVMEAAGEGGMLSLRRALSNSVMLSSDVSAAMDPAYENVFESKNSAYLGRGLVFNKYTGARGKSGSNDARAEYVAQIRRVMDDANVSFQTAELGRVDAGGGGTIAYIPARYGMDVIDSGVPVLSMHSPWEITSKADIYEAYKGYKAFLKNI